MNCVNRKKDDHGILFRIKVTKPIPIPCITKGREVVLLMLMLMLLIYNDIWPLGLAVEGKTNPMLADFFHKKLRFCKGGGLLVFLLPVFYLVLLK